MGWLWRLKPWLWGQEHRNKRNGDARVDSKRPSSEGRREQCSSRDGKANEKEHVKSTDSLAFLWSWRQQVTMDHDGNRHHSDGRNSAAFKHWPQLRKKRDKTSQDMPSASPTTPPAIPTTPSKRPANRQPVYRQPRSAAAAFLQTTKHPSNKRRSHNNPTRRPHSISSKQSSVFAPSPLAQVVEESDQPEGSRGRNRR
ncbi:hypothetical protein EV356DRAFT_518416 [Viridothelium virens]|uniref:Uncharacterized protein n=1 Tax=Viridothelium virens TaxID=1048519 RepID=A0A6A6H1T8_VIRVR|nr:hypothetical protein EV356DRAFT_518416 [Viridothelium virens]